MAKSNSYPDKVLFWISLLIGCLVLLTAIILGVTYLGKERYSPYRGTGGCPSSSWEYHREYDSQDYYKKYPYIYPTPPNYIKAWYSGRRANDKFLAEERKKMEQKIRNMNM